MLAKEFNNYESDKNILIFASGVSNSKETSLEAFSREKNLLINTINKLENQKIVYFSTCSMYDTYFENNAYTKHKLEMENIIKSSCKNYIIFRLPQVLGLNNKYQLMGFLYEKIVSKQVFELYDIERNIIDIEDIKVIVNYILEHKLFKNRTINIANSKNIKVIDLVKKMEKIYNLKADYIIVKKDGEFNIDTSDIDLIIKEFNLFEDSYIEKRLRNYYG